MESLGYKNISDFIFTPDLLREAEMMGVPPQMLMMMKYAQETGNAPPALQEMAQNLMNNKMAQAAQNAGIYQRQQTPQEEGKQPQQKQ